MAAFKSNIRITQGDTLTKNWTYKAGASGAETAVDLTGCTARMQIRTSATAATALVTLTTEDGGITLGGAAGTIEVLIGADVTADFTFKQAVYDLEITFANGHKRTLIAGNVYVTPEITQ